MLQDKCKFDQNLPISFLSSALNFVFWKKKFSGKMLSIGHGTWGEVFVKDGCAIKYQKADSICGQNEWRMWSRVLEFRHPGLVHICAMKKELYNDVEYLVTCMELCDRHNAYDMLEQFGAFSMPMWKRAYKEIASAVTYLHSCNLTHGDIKPENILVKDDHFKLCDFGMLSDKKCSFHMSGSPFYIAPEQRCSISFNLVSCDIWSFGVTMFVIHRATFLGKEEKILEHYLKNKAAKFTPRAHATDNDNINLCGDAIAIQYSLTWNPAERIIPVNL